MTTRDQLLEILARRHGCDEDKARRILQFLDKELGARQTIEQALRTPIGPHLASLLLNAGEDISDGDADDIIFNMADMASSMLTSKNLDPDVRQQLEVIRNAHPAFRKNSNFLHWEAQTMVKQLEFSFLWTNDVAGTNTSVSNPGKRKTPPSSETKITRAVKAWQRAELMACRARQRTEAQWQAEYDAAMTLTRAARSKEVAEWQ
jgi:hypothetical protein